MIPNDKCGQVKLTLGYKTQDMLQNRLTAQHNGCNSNNIHGRRRQKYKSNA